MNFEYRNLSLTIRHSIFGILFCFASAWGQSNTREPNIGYLYPAGAQQGTVIKITTGRDRVRVTLTVPPNVPAEPVALHLEGHAQIGGSTMSRLAVPADDVMKAFLYWHLVPAQEFLVFIQKARWGAPLVELVGNSPVRIPAGGSVQVQLKIPGRANFKDVQLQLDEPPDGLIMHDVTVVPDGISFQLKAGKDAIHTADNLIMEAFREYAVKNKDGKPTGQKGRNSMGVLPAIPIEIVQQ